MRSKGGAQHYLTSTDGERIGLIAGNGRFPIIFADNARKLGYHVSAVAHEGETEPELANHVDRIHWIKIGQLNKLIQAFKEDGVHQAVMLGGIKKTHVFTTVRPDFRTLALAARLALWKDDEILREFAKELEREGIAICESTFGLEGILVEEGTLTAGPSEKEWEDIRYGWDVAQDIGRLDIGQCVVVKDRVVVAVEAVEGTDEAIKRGGELAKDGAVVVKRCKPQQDLRFDLPAVGPRTIEVMASVKAAVLAVEAGRTILLDREMTLQKAQSDRIAVVGMVRKPIRAEGRRRGDTVESGCDRSRTSRPAPRTALCLTSRGRSLVGVKISPPSGLTRSGTDTGRASMQIPTNCCLTSMSSASPYRLPPITPSRKHACWPASMCWWKSRSP